MIRAVVMLLVLTGLAWLLVVGVQHTAWPACPVPVCVKA